jgi:hypothetical protein
MRPASDAQSEHVRGLLRLVRRASFYCGTIAFVTPCSPESVHAQAQMPSLPPFETLVANLPPFSRDKRAGMRQLADMYRQCQVAMAQARSACAQSFLEQEQADSGRSAASHDAAALRASLSATQRSLREASRGLASCVGGLQSSMDAFASARRDVISEAGCSEKTLRLNQLLALLEESLPQMAEHAECVSRAAAAAAGAAPLGSGVPRPRPRSDA